MSYFIPIRVVKAHLFDLSLAIWARLLWLIEPFFNTLHAEGMSAAIKLCFFTLLNALEADRAQFSPLGRR